MSKSIILHHKSHICKHFSVLMTNKATFCTSLRLIRTVFSRLQLKVRPKGLHSFAFYILIFAFSFTQYAIHNTQYEIQSTKAYVRKNNLFMQNKANFRKVKLNVTKVLINDYDQIDTWSIRKNEPKTNPNEPKTNPIKANKMPKQTQFKPNQTQTSQFQRKKMCLVAPKILTITNMDANLNKSTVFHLFIERTLFGR